MRAAWAQTLHRAGAWLVWLALAVAVWAMDGQPSAGNAARTVAALAVVWGGWLYVSRRRGALELPAPASTDWAWASRGALALVALLWLLILAQLLARIPLGDHGIDFAIFAQAISSISREGLPWVSLIGPQPKNFLTHHFVPYLYVPAALARLGVHPAVAGILVHCAGLALGWFALWRIFRALELSPVHASLLLAAAAFGPDICRPFGWTMNDEMYGAPFVAAGLWLWLEGKYRASAAAFVVSCLCKESFSLVTLSFTAVALLWHDDFRPAVERASARRALVPLAVLSALLFLGYFFLQPLWLGKGFDHASKLASPRELFAPTALKGKLLYLRSLLAPTLGLGFASSRGRKLLLLAAPGVLFSLVSRFDQMWVPHNYYAVTPVLVSFVAVAASWKRVEGFLGEPGSAAVLVTLWMLAFFSTGLQFADTLRDASQKPWLKQAQLAWVPREARVVADPAAAVFLLDHPNLRRMWDVANEAPPLAEDLVIRKPHGYENPSASMLEQTEPCHPTPLWDVRCARP